MAILKEKFKGRWRYRWQTYSTDPLGKRKRKSSKWFGSKAEAEEDLKNFQMDPKKESRSKLTFDQVHNEWVEYAGQSNTKKTKKDKESSIEQYFRSLLGMNIFDITPLTIKETMNDSGFIALGTKRKNKIHGYMKSIFSYTEDFHDLPHNPMQKIPTFKATDQGKMKEVEILSPDDFEILRASIPPEHSEYQALFIFLYWTGMRLNEAASLTFSDIPENKVRVWRQWKNEDGWMPLKIKGSSRVVTIDADLMAIVREQRIRYSQLPRFSPDWFIFGGPRHLAYTSIERVKNDAVKVAGLLKIKIHSFRHSHAPNLIAAGVPLINISKRLGHSSVSMTSDNYGHLVDRSEDDILTVLHTVKKKTHINRT